MDKNNTRVISRIIWTQGAPKEENSELTCTKSAGELVLYHVLIIINTGVKLWNLKAMVDFGSV